MTESRTDIVLIGPVYPYKGGISHYTGLLCKALRRQFSVRMISYRMQYPKFLFRKEQKDYKNDSFRVEGTEYLIHTADPVNIIRCAARINRMDPKLVIIQWWHPYFAPCYSILSGRLRAKILFICHNVFPHERFPMDRLLTRMTLRHGDCFILHSALEAGELKAILPAARYAVNMHPTYSAFRLGEPAPFRKEENTTRLLFFGFVRPYKGLKVLLEAMSLLPENICLDVVGDFGGKREEYDRLISEKGLENRVLVRDGYVPDQEVGDYFRRCDAVVLPYLEATQSGIAQIAFGFEKPVIATRAGGLPEVVTDGKTGVLCEAGSAAAFADAVKRFCGLKDTVDFVKNIKADSYRFSWEHMVQTIADLTRL